MPKRLHPGDGPPFPIDEHSAWSVGSGGLTAAGQSELLKQIGLRLQADYQGILKEPTPDRIKDLMEKLEARSVPPDRDLHGEDT